jgi:amino acid permease
MKGLIVLQPASLQSLWHVTTANNYTNKIMLYDALKRHTQMMHHIKPMVGLSYLLQFYLVLWLFSGCYGNNLPFYSHTLKAAPLATMHHQGAISEHSLLTSIEMGFCHHSE